MKRLIAALLLWPALALGAHDFDGSTGYASGAAAEVTAPALTLACWVKSDSDTAAQIALAVGDFNITPPNSLRLQLRGPSAGDPISAVSVAAGTQVQADTSSGYTTSTWHSVVAVFGSTTSRDAYRDGGNKGSDTASSSPSGIDSTQIGAITTTASMTTATFFDGRIAECGVWNVALTDDEVASLAKGFAPPCIRRASLIAYYPMVRDTISLKDLFSATANHLTLAGTTAVADHPPIINCQ